MSKEQLAAELRCIDKDGNHYSRCGIVSGDREIARQVSETFKLKDTEEITVTTYRVTGGGMKWDRINTHTVARMPV